MTQLQQLTEGQSRPEVPINEIADTLSAAGIFGKKHPTTTGLVFGYYGGLYNGNTEPDGTVTCTDDADNYIVVERATGTVSVSTGTTNWNSTAYAKLYKGVAADGTVTYYDHRQDANGLMFNQSGSAVGLTLTSKSADYTLVLADANTGILHPSADTTPRTMTIPANASVAYDVGTVLSFVNQNSAGTMTIAITSDTMRLAGSGATGSRTLAANGIASAIKITSTEWLITGTGLT